jgi:hypothetical protein
MDDFAESAAGVLPETRFLLCQDDGGFREGFQQPVGDCQANNPRSGNANVESIHDLRQSVSNSRAK